MAPRFLHTLMFWKWHARLRCHDTIRCCQYVDQPNCNNPSNSKGH